MIRRRSHFFSLRFVRTDQRRTPSRWWSYGLCACALIGVFLTVLFSRTFVIEYVDIRSPNTIDASPIRSIVFEQMDRRSFLLFPQKNIFVFSKKQLEKTLREKFLVQNLSIKKKIPHTLSLTLDAKSFRLIWLNNESAFDVDSDGTIFRAVESGVSSFSRIRMQGPLSNEPKERKEADIFTGVPVVYDELVGKNTVGDTVLSRDAVLFIQSAYALFTSGGYKPHYVTTRAGDPTVRIVMEEGWHVLLTILDPVQSQYDHVAVVMSQRVKNNRSALHYIDARFDNRVYYK